MVDMVGAGVDVVREIGSELVVGPLLVVEGPRDVSTVLLL